LPPSCADCLEIWEPQPPGTLRACPRPVMGLLYLLQYKVPPFIKVLLPTDAQEKCFKRSIKIYIKTAPTCFGVITIIKERTI